LSDDPECGECGKRVPITSMWQNFRNPLFTCNSCICNTVVKERKEVWDSLHAINKYLHESSNAEEPPHFSTVYLTISKILGRYNW